MRMFLLFFMAVLFISPVSWAAFDNPPLPPVADIDNSRLSLKYGEVKSAERGYIIHTSAPTMTYKLAGIALPQDENAQLYLEQIIRHTDTYPLHVEPLEDQANRYSEPYAVFRSEGEMKSLQEKMIAEGLVRFFPFGLSFDSPLIADFQAAERQAREQKIGLWEEDSAVLDPDNIDGRLQGKMVLVSGTIADASIKGDYTYINFGDDWKTDFTLMIPAEVWEKFSQDDQFKLTTPTIKILARGTLSSYYGPMIKITHPAQVEILP